MNIQYSSLESLSVATGIGVSVISACYDVFFTSSVFNTKQESVNKIFSAVKCFSAEKSAITYGIAQSKRFSGRYIFLAPSGFTYCASFLPGTKNETTQGVVAGPFLMTELDDFIAVDLIARHNISSDVVSNLYDSINMIPNKSPVEARAICEMLALCAEQCQVSSGPFSVPYNEALAASIKYMDVLSRAILFIRNNYMKKIKLQDIANHVFISASHLSKIFREEIGQTPGNYITEVRVEVSKSLLRDPTFNILDISEVVGFESQSYFTRVFKKVEGVTPGEYRQKNRYK